MLSLIYANGFRALLVLTTVGAFLWAGRIERTVAVLFVVAWAATHTALLGSNHIWLGLETGVSIVDGLLLIGLLIVTLRTGHGWLICATSFQAIAVLGHLGKLVNPHMSQMAYALMANASIYPTQIALALGIWRYRRRAIAAAAATSSGTY